MRRKTVGNQIHRGRLDEQQLKTQSTAVEMSRIGKMAHLRLILKQNVMNKEITAKD